MVGPVVILVGPNLVTLITQLGLVRGVPKKARKAIHNFHLRFCQTAIKSTDSSTKKNTKKTIC